MNSPILTIMVLIIYDLNKKIHVVSRNTHFFFLTGDYYDIILCKENKGG